MPNTKTNFVRDMLVISQVILDAGIYWLSFSTVIFFWLGNYNSGMFDFEVRVFFTGIMIAIFYFNSLYDFKNWLFWDEMKAVLRSVALILLVIVLYLYSQKFALSRFTIAVSLLIFVPLCLITRYIFRRVFFAIGLLSTNIIILGAGRTGKIFAQKIELHHFTACKVIGFLDDDPNKSGSIIENIPVLGNLGDFVNICEKYQVDEAVVAISTASRKLLTNILDTIEFHVRQVHYIPDMYMLTTFSAQIRDLDGMPIISASQGLLNPLNRFLKSVIDYIGAIIALILFSPIMIWAAYKIKKEDGGPALFLQDRIGWKTKHFTVYKFRTMHVNADEETEKLFQNQEIKAEYEEGIKLKHDPRLTKIGAILRRTSIDELPQLFNIIKGEMSLIGPRPLTQSDADLAYGNYIAKKVYMVKPGLTGLWQVSGRSDLDREIRKEMNLYYIRNWSLWLDIVLLLRTVQVVITGKGAY